MSFNGWMSLGGQEIVNNLRAARYAAHVAPRLAPTCDSCGDLHRALGDEEYTSPALNQAPWFDPEIPESALFAGFYALSVSGIDDDTRQATVIQGTFDGGAIGRVRRAVKEVRVSGLLIAGDDCSLEYGMEWLKNALDGNPCNTSTSGCAGDDLCFFSCCPVIPEGAVDTDAEPIVEQVSLIGWQVTGGSWVAGRWELPSTPQNATGQPLPETCDDITLATDFVLADQTRVRLYVVDDSGDEVSSSDVAVLRRTNFARNPSFSTATENFWTAGPNTTLNSDPSFDDYAEVSTSADVTSGETLATAEGAPAEAGDPFSGRMTVAFDPEGLIWENVVPNPAVRTLGGFNTDDGVQRDTTRFFTDSGSAFLPAPQDSATGIGPILYGETDDRYAIRVSDDETYGLSAYVRLTVAGQARLTARWLATDGTSIASVAYTFSDVPANTWTRLTEESGAPPGAVRLVLGVEASGSFNIGDRLNVDALMVSPQQPLVEYFDGSYADARWAGLPHSSVSVLDPSGDEACVQLAVDLPGGSVMGDPVVITPGSPVELSVSDAVAAQTGDVTLSLVSCGSIPQGTVLRVSRALIERWSEPGPYFSGDTPDTERYRYEWSGTPGLSESTQSLSGALETVAPPDGTLRPAIEAVSGDVVEVTSMTASYRPEIDPQECADTYERRLRDVATIQGPTVLQDYDLCDGAMRRVEFVLAAGVPWTWQLVQPEFVVSPGDDYLTEDFNACEEEEPQPINDPDCPLPPPPPRPPKIEGCNDLVPVFFRRRTVEIPGDVISPSQKAVPIITLDVGTGTAVRNTRIRFYPDPLGRGNVEDLGECSWCGEFVITYMPGTSQIVLDGMTESAIITTPGDVSHQASHLLRSSDGGPMVWPLLTCGLPYVMTVDTAPTTADVITTEMQLAVRS